MGEVSSEGSGASNEALFPGAPKKKTKRSTYKVEEIALALKRFRGRVTAAANWLGCSHTTIDTYLAESEDLRNLRASFRRRRIDSATTNIERAIDDTCWECNGSKEVPVKPKHVGDPDKAACPVCDGTGFYGGKEEKIDPAERRHYSLKVLERQARDEGWGETLQVMALPADFFDNLTEDQADALEALLKNKVPLREAYAMIVGGQANSGGG
jgi:hypothetical protein